MRYDNAFAYPSTGLAGRLANRIVASGPLLRARRALLSRLPFLQLARRSTHGVRDALADKYCENFRPKN
ncbi:hypothetical protein [Burkholderia sp. Bp8992]|uniref:hypothetical protein n=1 Tax=Burkholderia sp. Bp8992 TaxID=2184554 RepID=UPI001625C001|nr:hypothetical protein [Burkholderia sp. Bp8992]